MARAGSSELPLFPLNTVLFPGGPLPLRIFEPRYVDMVRNCMREGAPFGVVLIHAGQEAGAVSSAADVGTSARIIDFDQMPDGLLGIVCTGEQKFRVDDRRVQSDGLNIGTVTWLPLEPPTPLLPQHAHLGLLLRRVMPQLGAIYEALPAQFDDAGWVWVITFMREGSQPDSAHPLHFLVSEFDGVVGWLVLAWTVVIGLVLYRFYARKSPAVSLQPGV